MLVSIRKFEEKDIPLKVKWINDPLNNKYLHYDLPLEESKTKIWFKNNQNKKNRYDAIIEVDNNPIGLIGLLNIDEISMTAEYYITIGNRDYLNKGISVKASKLLLDYAFKTLNLNEVYLYTEYDNISAQKSFEKVGFKRIGLLKNKLFYNGKQISRYYYCIRRRDHLNRYITPLIYLGKFYGNNLYIKRDDLYPYCFGGNKARKGVLFFDDFLKSKSNCLVTYGSASSNHCRVIANFAASNNIPCYIVSPEEIDKETSNKQMMKLFGAHIIFSKILDVSNTIEGLLIYLKNEGYKPYFIQGGGHGNIGTRAYVECYNEIKKYEFDNNLEFDYIFHASGTGTTQAGLVCGELLYNDKKKIVGISIARKSEYGRQIVINSINDYLQGAFQLNDIQKYVIFDDLNVLEGYGQYNDEILYTIDNFLVNYGIPLDRTYTGKAIDGMRKYLNMHDVTNKNILFIHTGGTPIFFDDLNKNK